MKKIEAIIQPSAFGAIKHALGVTGIETMVTTTVQHHPMQNHELRVFRGSPYAVDSTPHIKIELMLPDHRLDSAVSAIMKAGNGVGSGDHKVFISEIEDVSHRSTEQTLAPAYAL